MTVKSCAVSTKLGWRKVSVAYLGELHFGWGEEWRWMMVGYINLCSRHGDGIEDGD